MDEIKVEVALEIIQLKIVQFLKNNKGNNKEEFKQELANLVEEKQKIHELDEDVIKKVYNIYLPEVRKEKTKWGNTI